MIDNKFAILDNDLYKFTMQSAVLELFPNAVAKYKFINRGSQRFNNEFLNRLKSKINSLAFCSLSDKEKEWFKNTCNYIKPQYFEYLQNYRFDPREVKLFLTEDNNLDLTIEGPWYRTILWEVPLLAAISKIYYETIDVNWTFDEDKYRINFAKKIELLKEFFIADFGTRRRRNFDVQEAIVSEGSKYHNFVGTSNVLLAKEFNLKLIGTMAHEWIMANSVLEGLRNANYYALHNWVRVFNADLGIALTDTYGTDAFLNNFNLRLSKLFDGVRQDSGDPYAFADRMIKHYKSLGINPMYKNIVFSDNLNAKAALDLGHYCTNRIRCSFGIGTNFTNDFKNSPPLNIVIKMSELNGIPVVKLGEDETKACGDKDALRVAKWTFLNEPLDD